MKGRKYRKEEQEDKDDNNNNNKNTNAQKDTEKSKGNIMEDMQRMKVEESQEGK